MDGKNKDNRRQTVSFSAHLDEWVKQYASEHGIDYTAAVNSLLAVAKRKIELDYKREERLSLEPATGEDSEETDFKRGVAQNKAAGSAR